MSYNTDKDNFNINSDLKNQKGQATLWADLLLYPETITKLDLSEMKYVDDETLKVVKRFHDLESLNLAGCNNVTEEGIKYLNSLPLKQLNLTDCNKIDEGHRKILSSKELSEIIGKNDNFNKSSDSLREFNSEPNATIANPRAEKIISQTSHSR